MHTKATTEVETGLQANDPGSVITPKTFFWVSMIACISFCLARMLILADATFLFHASLHGIEASFTNSKISKRSCNGNSQGFS